MSFLSRPRLLVLSISDYPSEKLAAYFQNSELEVVVKRYDDAPPSSFLTEQSDYCVVLGSEPFYKEGLTEGHGEFFESLATHSKEKGSKLLFLLPDASRSLGMRLLTVSPSVGILYIKKSEGGETGDSVFLTEDAFVKGIARNIFSLRAYGQEQTMQVSFEDEKHSAVQPTFVPDPHPPVSSGPRIVVEEVPTDWEALKNKGELRESISDAGSPALTQKPAVLEESIRKSSVESVDTIAFQPEEHVPLLPHPVASSPKKKFSRRKVVFGVFVLLLVVTLPYLLSFSSFFLSTWRLGSQAQRSSVSFMDSVVVSYANSSETLSSWYVQSGILPSFYNGALSTARTSNHFAKASANLPKLRGSSYSFLQHVFSGSSFAVEDEKQSILFVSDAVYADLGFGLAEIETVSFLKALSARVVDYEMVKGEREYLETFRTLMQSLPDALGKEKSKKYAVVIQNSKNLWSSGGTISGLAILTFEGGYLRSSELFVVKGDENAFAGTIAAPLPLEQYLGKSNWALEDANWAASFPEAAERISWFIEKEFDQNVDGVFAISDKTLLEIGKNAGVSISGSSDSKEFVSSGIAALTAFFKGFDRESAFFVTDQISRKNVLGFVSQESLQSSLSRLNFAGDHTIQPCDGNCYADGFGVVEANFGEMAEKISREVEFKSSIEEGTVKRAMTYYLKNEESETYKTYVRVVVPEESGFSPVTILSQDGKTEEELEVFASSGMKEGGVYVEIPAGKTIGLIFLWESRSMINLASEGSYSLAVFKQPGVSEYPISIEIEAPRELGMIFPSASLTKGTSVYYNTLLARDFSSHIFWK